MSFIDGIFYLVWGDFLGKARSIPNVREERTVREMTNLFLRREGKVSLALPRGGSKIPG
jgi:hypothetical protein